MGALAGEQDHGQGRDAESGDGAGKVHDSAGMTRPGGGQHRRGTRGGGPGAGAAGRAATCGSSWRRRLAHGHPFWRARSGQVRPRLRACQARVPGAAPGGGMPSARGLAGHPGRCAPQRLVTKRHGCLRGQGLWRAQDVPPAGRSKRSVVCPDALDLKGEAGGAPTCQVALRGARGRGAIEQGCKSRRTGAGRAQDGRKPGAWVRARLAGQPGLSRRARSKRHILKLPSLREAGACRAAGELPVPAGGGLVALPSRRAAVPFHVLVLDGGAGGRRDGAAQVALAPLPWMVGHGLEPVSVAQHGLVADRHTGSVPSWCWRCRR